MAENILKLRVDSQEYDNKLKRAAEGLQRYADSCRKTGGTLEHLDEGVEDFAKALGKMDTVSRSAKGSLSEMTKSFTDLSMVYKQLTDAEKQSPFGKALSASLDNLRDRIQSTKSDLDDINKSIGDMKTPTGLFGGGKLDGMLQVFGGNLMTKGAGMLAGLASEMGDMIRQGVELAKQGEGVRIAFERLGRGDILQGLREATHGTVTDLELMKAAVKFNDFKLPVEELGTMLAFAQQKAKDTGQSVDYMVDSIVTGLGRKSLMILDNLGLSAAEIKEKMKETGDMTKAVGAIIREQMAKAGEYVETAADRAAKANVDLQNKMEELGRKFAPLQEASNNLWTSMKIGIMNIVGGPLTDFINKMTEAGRLASQYGVLGGSGKVGRMTQNLSNAREENRQSIYKQQQEQFWRYINPREQQIKDIRAWQRGERGEALQSRIAAITEKYGSLDATKIQAEVDAAKKMLAEYIAGAKAIFETNPSQSPALSSPTSPKGVGGSSSSINIEDKIQASFDKLLMKTIAESVSMKPLEATGPSDAWRAYTESQKKNTDELKSLTDALGALNESEGISKNGTGEKGVEKTDKDSALENTTKVVNGLSAVASGLQSMGVKLPDGVQKILGIAQGIISVIQGVNTVISVFSSTSQAANTTAILANTAAQSGAVFAMGTLTAAVAANTAALATNTAVSIIPFARGGIVPHAANGFVPGNDHTDSTEVMVSSGELILNKAQQGNLASQLGEGGLGGVNLSAVVTGEQIHLVHNRYLRRIGEGEILTWK